MTFSSLVKTVSAAALLSVAVAGSAFAGVADLNAWRGAVIKEVAKNQKYPRAAVAREIEGTAKIKLVVAPDGTIKSHEILKTTGNQILDAEIPKLIERLNPLPALPAGQAEMALVLPLSWTLN